MPKGAQCERLAGRDRHSAAVATVQRADRRSVAWTAERPTRPPLPCAVSRTRATMHSPRHPHATHAQVSRHARHSSLPFAKETAPPPPSANTFCTSRCLIPPAPSSVHLLCSLRTSILVLSTCRGVRRQCPVLTRPAAFHPLVAHSSCAVLFSSLRCVVSAPFCGCFSDCSSCLCSYLLPCVQFGYNAEAAGDDCCLCCLVYAVSLHFGACCIPHGLVRSKIRQNQGLPEVDTSAHCCNRTQHNRHSLTPPAVCRGLVGRLLCPAMPRVCGGVRIRATTTW